MERKTSASIEPALRLGRRRLRHSSESALSPTEFAHGGGQIARVELGPHAACEDEFGVSAFPQKKVAQALLAAGADQQINRRPQRLAQSNSGWGLASSRAAARIASRAE